MKNQINSPTLLLDEGKAQANIERMHRKANEQSVRLRPHFKTHQAHTVGRWFRQRGVSAITVSSLKMADYFAQDGWDDITVAFPVNLRQIGIINDLASRIRLHVLVESVSTAVAFAAALNHPVHVWIKIDAGYGRTGIRWDDTETISAVAQTIVQATNLHLSGILSHAGDTYHAPSPEAIRALYRQTVLRLNIVRQHLQTLGVETAVSIGDTPGCSLIDDFGAVDEIRPGNFVFYDLMQMQLGACTMADIAVGVACPVVAKHADQRIVIYGGAVHFSKEVLEVAGQSCYGRIALLNDSGWGTPFDHSLVTSLSQEHGLVQAELALFDAVDVGDLLLVLPIHSCLTADLYPNYMTINGQIISKMMTN